MARLWAGGLAAGLMLAGCHRDGDAGKAAAKGGNAPIEVLAKDFDHIDTVKVDYHGGLLYPSLVRLDGKPDRLSELYKAR